MSIKASETLYSCREKICSLLNSDEPEKVILMPSCTMALNTVIKGLVKKGDHVIISSLEHNSVLRPLKVLAEKGIITFDIATVYEADADKTLDSFRSVIRDNTKLCICTHASNVFGIKMPVARISALCHYYGILFCLDAAQTAGVTDIDVNQIGADYLCAPGHKGLYGPMGTGFLIINNRELPCQLVEGGTGSSSADYGHPAILPDKYESGTINLSGFAGLSAGVDFVKKNGIQNIENKEMKLIQYLYDELSTMNGVVLYTKRPESTNYVPLLSFNVDGFECNDLSGLLDTRYKIAVRAGIHCSPIAHKTFNTLESGTIRVSPSVFTDTQSVKTLINAIYSVIKNKKIFI